MKIDEDGSRHPTLTDNGIFGFFDDYRYLSNYHLCRVKIGDITYGSSEAAYMAEKCPARKTEFHSLSPSEAKKLGQKVPLRSDWEYYRVIAMMKVLYAKFDQNKELGCLLKVTGNKYLEETNNWGDKFWGVSVVHRDNYIALDGQNILGRCLMAVREMI